MIHILLIVIGIVLIVVNRDIKNERADDGGSFANILKNEEKESIPRCSPYALLGCRSCRRRHVDALQSAAGGV